jgi:hypothetical protein
MLLWSQPPPLLAALHCHCLLHIVSIQLGHCTPPPSPPPSPASNPAPSPPPSRTHTCNNPSALPSALTCTIPCSHPSVHPSIVVIYHHFHHPSSSSIISCCVAPPPLSLPLCIGSLGQRLRYTLALLRLSFPWALLASFEAPCMSALPWWGQHYCAPPLPPSSLSLLSFLACPTTPVCCDLFGHHCQLIVTYFRPHLSSSIVVVRRCPPSSHVMLPPPHCLCHCALAPFGNACAQHWRCCLCPPLGCRRHPLRPPRHWHRCSACNIVVLLLPHHHPCLSSAPLLAPPLLPVTSSSDIIVG